MNERIRPGDIVSDNRGHLWFTHGNPHLGLHLTNAAGSCATVADVERLFGTLTLQFRLGIALPSESLLTSPDGHSR
ncbi:hypothetical protein [Streptosporangium sp. NPDC051022]|uniref:hypothetical protein n=1 Tax=Streptosporangium sp. NPDC051022 TaxID=3155752 RepID=UPI003448F576